MNSGSLAAELDQLIVAAGTAYQSFQLAAQQADLEGQSLAAAVFRSISEGHSGKAQGLMQIRAAMVPSAPDDGGATEANSRAALQRDGEVEVLSREVARLARATLPGQLADDLDAVLGLTATNRTRLEGLLATLQKSRAQKSPA